MQYNNGLKFSFSLLSRPTPDSTPKFTSIDIQHEIKVQEKQSFSAMQEVTHIRPQYRSTHKQSPKRNRILEKYSHLTLMSNTEKSERDSKSVKSVQSSKSRTYRSKAQASHLKIMPNKNRHSSASSANIFENSPYNKSKRQHFSLQRNQSVLTDHSHIGPMKKVLSGQRSQEKVIITNFIELAKSTNKFKPSTRLFTPKQGETSIKPITDKGKSFKSIFHKTKPVLRLHGRMLSTSKLQQLSRPQQIEQQTFQL